MEIGKTFEDWGKFRVDVSDTSLYAWIFNLLDFQEME